MKPAIKNDPIVAIKPHAAATLAAKPVYDWPGHGDSSESPAATPSEINTSETAEPAAAPAITPRQLRNDSAGLVARRNETTTINPIK
jgi:hypothetical protein